ncbi:S1C family serine protease [Deinococcus yavapaiensis]|uniref:S1-C subfamily serine protease n=1 Tax=Deinococcus yavapaiensis KR-236 TaxID=694435 RepID=A0A318S9J8_9DEIO|nr:trypsin-like peptidase domain-containing protein [Deinococcus yavapaiensis]PYE52887.1 S1-C subfamily serine protease [Deinococcus yavapaiensis KR-236]
MKARRSSKLLVLSSLAALGVVAGTTLAQRTPTTAFHLAPGISPADVPSSLQTVYQRTRTATVRVTNDDGLGTGFFISKDGLVLTAAHVALSGGPLKVTTTSGQRLNATLVGFDEYRDLAVLKVNTTRQANGFLALADASPNVGAAVLAVGNSRGDFNAPRTGEVTNTSATLGASFPSALIKTTMPLAPGDSGGPVVNAAGQVVGVSTAVGVSQNGYASYISPVTKSSKVLTEIRAGVKRGTPMLGVTITNFDEETAASLGLGRPGGVLVTGVSEGSGAAKAGVRAPRTTRELDERGFSRQRILSADVITAVDGRRVVDGDALVGYLRTKKIGDRVVLTVQRDAKSVKLTVTLGAKTQV